MELSIPYIPSYVALALVAAIGYWFGCRGKAPLRGAAPADSQRCWERAALVANELEVLTESIRKELAAHGSSVARFKRSVRAIGKQEQELAWKVLTDEVEEVLGPTLRLADRIAYAQDVLRQEANHLLMFSDLRIDSLTRVNNRRAMDDCVDSLFAMFHRYQQICSVVVVDVDHFKHFNEEQGSLYGDRKLQELAQLIDHSVRKTDLVIRYEGEKFVVLLPCTELAGAVTFADRLRQSVEDSLRITVSGGVAEIQAGDDPNSLLDRANAALQQAKADGRNRICRGWTAACATAVPA